MAYPRDQLADHEELVLDLHPHWIYLAKQVGALVLSIIVGILAITVLGDDGAASGVRIVAAILIVGCLIWFGARYVKWTTTQLVLTTDRLIYRTGVFAKSGLEFPLERINTVFFGQSVWERLLGAGDLRIESASTEGAQIFESIKKPAAVQNEIYKQMEANETRSYERMHHAAAASVPPSPATLSIPDQIAQLGQLRDQGMLSDAEFQQKKAELLGRM